MKGDPELLDALAEELEKHGGRLVLRRWAATAIDPEMVALVTHEPLPEIVACGGDLRDALRALQRKQTPAPRLAREGR